MHATGSDQRGEGRQADGLRCERETERAIVGLLLCDPHVWTAAEIERELRAGTTDVQDALGGLDRAGLVNIDGRSISASRSARAMDELDA